MKRCKNLTGGWCLILSVLILVGCATGPRINTRQDWYTLLPDKATAYLFLQLSPVTAGLVKSMTRETLAALQISSLSGTMKKTDTDTWLDPLLERTENVALAFEKNDAAATVAPATDSPLLVYGLLEGRYPKNLINSSLRKNVDWREVKGSFAYWDSPVYGLQIFIIDHSTILFANGGLETLLQRYRDFPHLPGGENILIRKIKERESEPVRAEIKITAGNTNTMSEKSGQAADVSTGKDELLFFLSAFNEQNLGQNLRSAGVNLPLEQLLISADRKGKEYFFASTMEFREEQAPQETSHLLRLALLYLLRKGEVSGLTSRLKGLEIKQENAHVFINGLKLSDIELEKILFNLIASQIFEKKVE